MSRRIVVTGASSFLGAHLVRALARAGHEVVAVVHRTPLQLVGNPSRVVSIDLAAPGAGTALADLDPACVVHLAMKLADPAANDAMLDAVLEAARLAASTVIHASTTQVGWAKPSAYGLGRQREEARVAASGLPHVILRPCAPYGPRLPDHRPAHVESFHRLADVVRRGLLVPVIGDGSALRQPVHVDDWNDVIVRFAGRDRLPDRAFDVGGPRAWPVRALIDKMALAAGTAVRVVAIPVPVAAFAARFVAGMPPDVVRAFPNDDVADPADVAAELGKDRWIRFEQGAHDLFGVPWRDA